LVGVKKPYRSAAFLEAAKEKRAQAAIDSHERAVRGEKDFFVWGSVEDDSRREIARLKMPMTMTGLGRLLTCFSEEFAGCYAKQEGNFLFIYVDVEAVDL
jgi:hypothetical protein